MLEPITSAPRYKAITRSTIRSTPYWSRLSPQQQEAVDVVSLVLPFRCNTYVADNLIDWGRIPDDPIFQLTFPQPGMLAPEHYHAVRHLLQDGAPREVIEQRARKIRLTLNPHPAGQMTHNVPMLDGEEVRGIQHKYRETVLFFPSQGQTCHAYCTFCFRWPQFVGMEDLKFASAEAGLAARYVRENPDVTDVLITGGDPMVMKTRVLERIIEPLLELDQLLTIRIGTKSLAYWPARFVTDDDADDCLRLFERVADSGKQLALMAHCSHPVEFEPDIAKAAVRRVRSAGANVRMQSPVIRHVNDHSDTWAELWRRGARLGCVPYYMFVERDTGSKAYFELPLARTWRIFRDAYQQVSGIARTVRGPSMSCMPGKCHVLGLARVAGRRAFVLEFLQARDPSLVRTPFFARFDPRATWFDQLTPLRPEDERFFPSTQRAGDNHAPSDALDDAKIQPRLAALPGLVPLRIRAGEP